MMYTENDMAYMAKALNEVAKLACELEKASGKTFTVGSESSESNSIDIFEVMPDGSYKHVLHFYGSTWMDAFFSVYTALTTLYFYQMIQSPTHCGHDA